MYGKKYQWIFNGWYSLNWVNIESTDCSVEQMTMAAQYALTADSLTYDMSDEIGISGQVCHSLPLSQVRKIILVLYVDP